VDRDHNAHSISLIGEGVPPNLSPTEGLRAGSFDLSALTTETTLRVMLVTNIAADNSISDAIRWVPRTDTRLASPTNFAVGLANVLRWNALQNATLYRIYADGSLLHTTSNNFWNFENNIPGDTVSLRIIAHAPGFIDSYASYHEWTSWHFPDDIDRLAAPAHLRVEESRTLRWSVVEHAQTYMIFVNGILTHTTNNNFWEFGANPAWANPGQNVHLSVIASADDFLNSRTAIINWTRPGGTTQPDANTRHAQVQNSWATGGNSGQGHHRIGQPVTIHAGHRPGFEFVGWFVHQPTTQDFVLVDFQNRTTTFIMPNSNVHVEAFWWREGDPMPNLPWWPGTGAWREPVINWQSRNLGGISFNYQASNFPDTLNAGAGTTVNLQLQIQRHLAAFNANFVGQWMRGGTPMGDAFPITLNHAGIANIDLTTTSGGDYSLRVATLVNGLTTHVDTSRVAAISITGETTATTQWPADDDLPPLPAVNPMPTPRPNLAFIPPGSQPDTSGRAVITSAPSHNHDLVMLNTENGSVVLQIQPGTDHVQLHGRTLDALIEQGTTLFVVNDLVWVIMPPDFMTHLRERAGRLIGPSGGTFNISINETYGGQSLITAQVGITTTIAGQTRELTEFGVPYSLAIELSGFGIAGADANHMAVHHGQNRLASNTSTETGVLSFNALTTGNFDVNYMLN